jgi:hypothetical protein
MATWQTRPGPGGNQQDESDCVTQRISKNPFQRKRKAAIFEFA